MKFCRIYRAVIEIPVQYDAADDAAAAAHCPSDREMEEAICKNPELTMSRAVCSCQGVGSEPKRQRECRVCGGTDDYATPEVGAWVALDLCSACAEKGDRTSVDGDTY
jgi:hypothetical protein